jgi:hypothetical protein
MGMDHSRICNVVPESYSSGTDDKLDNKLGSNRSDIDSQVGTLLASRNVSIEPVRKLTGTKIGTNGYSARTGKAGELTLGITSIVAGYGQMVQDRVAKGWSCDLLTFMFNSMVGSEANLLVRMADELQRVYSTFITRAIRKPRSISLDRLPLLIAAADLPVYKRNKSISKGDIQNGGLHCHGVLLVPPSSRLKTTVKQHLEGNPSVYLGHDGVLQHLHSKGVNTEHGYVVEYVFKTVLKRRLQYNEAVLVLPKTHDERGG